MVKRTRATTRYEIPIDDIIVAMGIQTKTTYKTSLVGPALVIEVDEALDDVVKDVVAEVGVIAPVDG